MAKSKARKDRESQPDLRSKISTGGTSTKAALPTFDESALSNLTQKLEVQLSNPKGEKAHSHKRKQKQRRVEPESMKDRVSKTITKDGTPHPKGKKRGRNGEVLPSNSSAPPIAERPNWHEGTKDLEEEIYALGGTEEDLELIEGLESSSEIVDESRETNSKGSLDVKSLRKHTNDLTNNIHPPEDLDKSQSSDQSLDSDATESISDMGLRNVIRPAKSLPPPQAANDSSLGYKTAPKRRGKLSLDPRPDWYAAQLPSLPNLPKNASALPQPLLDRLQLHAKSLLEAENRVYSETTEKGSSSRKFYNTIMSSGTLTDKISALTLSAQESPLHNMKALENLLGLARKRSRAQAVDVLRALKDLFAQGSLLPSDRKLKHFHNQSGLVAAFSDTDQKWTPGNPLPNSLENAHLIVWAFEHWLKDFFFEVLKLLEIWCNDEIEFARARAVSYVWELLKDKPEQEANLLRLLVNKLGDPNKKIASRASYLLLQLESAHPLMKATIISAVDSEFLFKPGQSQHAKYYGVITLNQTALAGNEIEVANKLLDIYFTLFVAFLKPEERKPPSHKDRRKTVRKGKKDQDEKKPDMHNTDHETALREKMISAILTGVNRAYPYSSENSERLSKHIDALFKITHSSNFNTSIQALMLIQQMSSAHQVSTARYYKTLYESLLDPRLIASSKQSLYLNLLYRSLKQDVNVQRLKAFVKRIVQILNLHQPSFVFGAFHLIKELEQTFPSLKGLVDEAQDVDSDDEEVFKDVPEDDQRDGEQVRVEEAKKSRRAITYDNRKRDPEHSNANRSCLWELSPFLAHFHPSIAVSSSNLLNHKPMEGKPDLTLHTLTHFLDRFVYRNPKSAATSLRGTSIMQPLVGSERADLLVTAHASTRLQKPVNDESFWKKQAGEVAAEDTFFHEYFMRMGKEKKPSRKDKPDSRKAPDSETDEEEESEIWKALVRSKGDIEADEDSDVDLDMEDIESDEDAEGVGGELDNETGEDMPEEGLDVDDSDDPWADSDEEVPSDVDATKEMVDADDATGESGKDSQKKKRRKLKQLPTFASAEDYAAMIDNDDGEDMR